MARFRLAIVDSCRQTGCLEVQQLVQDESDKPCWIHYIIVKDRAQAIRVIGELDPALAAQAATDLTSSIILNSLEDRSVEVRMAKHLRTWGERAKEYKKAVAAGPEAKMQFLSSLKLTK